jgi:hypothetical protein
MKKSIVPVWTAALAVLFLCGAAQPAHATHFRYGTLSWAPTGVTGQVEFRLRAAFRRDSIWGPVDTGAIILETQGPTMLNFGDGTNTGTLRFIITSHSVAENWVIGEALNPGGNNVGVRHTYANPGGTFTAFLANVSASACCRLSTLNNRPDGPYPLQSIVKPASGNHSPVSSMVPIVIVPPSADATFLVPGADADFDPLQYRMSTLAEAGGGPHPPNISVEPLTGLVHWNNIGLNQTNFWTTQVVVEDLTAPGGAVVSKTPVDFLLKIQPQIGSLPACSFNPPGPYTTYSGQPFTFTVTGTDADPADLVTLHSGGMPPGATLTPPLPVTGPSSGVSTVFNWTPTAAQAGAHVVIFSVTDTPGQQSLCSSEIQVINNAPPTVTCPAPITIDGCTGPGGSTVSRTAHVQDPNGDPLTVTWRVDGAVVQVDPVPAGGPPTSANVTLTHFYPLGTHAVRVDVTDGTLAAGCDTSVTVRDLAAPVVQCVNGTAALWPPNHNMINVGLAVAANDNCGGTVSTAVAVFGDEDDETPTGDGRFSPDAKDIAAGTLRLRAERRGDADGRVYLVQATATDPSGNTGTNCCAVTVTHSPSHKDVSSVAAQAAAAIATCQATGAPPPDYFVIGDGPVIGPKP